jgi:hypothetical protein
MLRDDIPNQMPTRQNIITNLANLAKNSSSLKELWIHYSGHGSQIKNKDGTEVSGYDSILVPIDYKTKGYILDTDILEIIKTIKCRTILLFDCCHSGTICDLPWCFVYSSQNTYSRIQNNNVIISNPNIFMFSGCKDMQTSADTFNKESDLYIGAFTNAFITCLRNNRHNIQYIYLFRDICLHLLNNGYTQVPVFSSSNMNPSLTLTRALPTSMAVQKSVAKVINSNMKSLIYS